MMDDPATILYIEDDPASRVLIRRLVENAGFRLVEAADGLAGLKKAEETRPVLILLDIDIPGLSGYDVAARLKSNPELEGIPIVALTASAMKGDREKTLKAGCDGYIQKPINAYTFSEILKAHLGTRRTKR